MSGFDDLCSDLQQDGDYMQSALSRIIEYIDNCLDGEALPYEVSMAVREGTEAIAFWTETRKQVIA